MISVNNNNIYTPRVVSTLYLTTDCTYFIIIVYNTYTRIRFPIGIFFVAVQHNMYIVVPTGSHQI